MGNLKKGWYVCESNFIQWRKNYRIWMIAAIETILIFRYLHGLSEYGQATGKQLRRLSFQLFLRRQKIVMDY